MKLQFNKYYFGLAVLLFALEVYIGWHVRDAIIRPYGGDYLVVMLVYCAVKAFFRCDVIKTAVGVLIFSYVVEAAQYFHLINALGLQRSATARMLMGTRFQWADLLAYTLGIITTTLIEGWVAKYNKKPDREVNYRS